MPTNILNLPAYAVTAFHENDHDYHITAEAKQRVTGCPHCRHTELDGFGCREQMVRSMYNKQWLASFFINCCFSGQGRSINGTANLLELALSVCYKNNS